MTKKEQIAQTRKINKARRSEMSCVVYTCKADKSHLSKATIDHLRMSFIEAKWLYNHILSREDIFVFDRKTKTVQVKNKDGEFENRELRVLSAQIRQGIYERLKWNIYKLASAKKKGMKVGKLKFKSEINSISLPQLGVAFRLVNDKYIKIGGLKKHIRVEGLEQIPQDAEIATATLLKKADDYYIAITCYIPKREHIPTGKACGIDFGIHHAITTSDGETFDINVPRSKRTKKLQHRLSKQIKHSRNYDHTKMKLRKSINKTNNKKKDARNKIVSYLIKTCDTIVIQDDNIAGWQSFRYGRQVEASAIGGIKADLKRKSATLIVVDRFYPSTKLCPECGMLNKIELSTTTYVCESCGYTAPRDIHAAKNILARGLADLAEKDVKVVRSVSPQSPVEARPLLHGLSDVQQVEPLKQVAVSGL